MEIWRPLPLVPGARSPVGLAARIGDYPPSLRSFRVRPAMAGQVGLVSLKIRLALFAVGGHLWVDARTR
jgi:hypothetical protein